MRRMLWSAALFSIALSAGIVLAGDQETSQQIADSLRSRLKNYSVGVKVEDGTVWLNGFVANQKQMSTAVETAQRVPGVERVVNNLAIGNVPAPAATLRQPTGDANTAQQFADPNRVNDIRTSQAYSQQAAQSSMDLPAHAQQELQMAASLPSGDNGGNQHVQQRSANSPGAPNYLPANAGNGSMNAAYYQGNPAAYNNASTAYYAPGPGAPAPSGNGMRAPAPSMPLAMGASNPAQFRPAAMQANPGMQGGPGGEAGGESIGAPQPVPSMMPAGPGAPAPYHFDHPQMPGYAWPSYAAYPNYAAVTYPKQYSPTAWPYIGPFYPYPQVPLGWRKVTLEWEDGWWNLDFKDSH